MEGLHLVILVACVQPQVLHYGLCGGSGGGGGGGGVGGGGGW